MSLSIKASRLSLRHTPSSMVLIMAILLAPAAFLLWPESVSSYSQKPACTDSLQQQVNDAPAGSTVNVRTDCIYRERVTIAKPLTLNGQGGAEIRGSDIWSSWTQVGATWVSVDTVPAFFAHGECSSAFGDRCVWPEQVFIEGNRVNQVAVGETPAPGQFALDSNRRIVLGDDPSGATVEVTTRTRWMSVTGSNVTIRGFVMKHAANDSQDGALRVDGTSYVTVKNNNLSYSHGALVVIFNSHFGSLIGNDLYNGGQQGFSVSTSNDITIEKNLIHHNNVEGFQWDWEAGAMKISHSSRVVFNDNDSYSNNGSGYWCDIDCSDVTISNNRVHHNMSTGIFFEISDGAEIFNNAVWENGWGRNSPYWITEAGILISSASNAEVYNNVVAWNADGIGVISQCRNRLPGPEPRRCDTSKPWNRVHGNYVHDNVIIAGNDPRSAFSKFALAWLRDIRDENDDPFNYMFTPEANNRGENNQYWVETAAGITYAWGNASYTRTQLPAFSATSGEEGGVLLNQDIANNTSRDAILLAHSLPTAPDNHVTTWPRFAPLDTSYSSSIPVTDPEPTPPVNRDPDPNPTPSLPTQNPSLQVSRPNLTGAGETPGASRLALVDEDSKRNNNELPEELPAHPTITEPANSADRPRVAYEPNKGIRVEGGILLWPLTIAGGVALSLGVGFFAFRKINRSE